MEPNIHERSTKNRSQNQPINTTTKKRNVQKIIRSKARSSHAGYKEVAELVGLDLKTLQQAKQAAAGPRLQKGDDGVYDLV